MKNFVVFVSLVCFTSIVSGAPTLWTNGNSYEVVFVADGIDWDSAELAAVNMGGYLATISSEAENLFVYSLLDEPMYWRLNGGGDGMGPWLGGSQPANTLEEPIGGWEWVTAEVWDYSNWGPTQPDDWNDDEDYLHYWADNALMAPTWNDVDEVDFASYIKGFVVEFEGTVIPVPGAGLLAGMGVGIVGWMRRRRVL